MKQTFFNFYNIARTKITTTSKFCPICKQTRPATEFYKMSASKDNLAGKCKTCQASYAKDRHQRLYQNANHRKKCCEQVKKSQKAHPERVKAYLKTYMKNNPIARWRKNVCKTWRKRYHTTPQFNASTKKILQHIESLFTNEMTWENYGTTWAIFRTKPISDFQDHNQANHYTNFIPKKFEYPNKTPVNI